MTRRHKDEGPAVRPTEPSALNQDLDKRIVGQAPAVRKCTGCAKPFTAVRKCRLSSVQSFAANNGRVGVLPVYLCGVCLAAVKAAGGRPWGLPGVEKAANELEQLVLAEQTGPCQ